MAQAGKKEHKDLKEHDGLWPSADACPWKSDQNTVALILRYWQISQF